VRAAGSVCLVFALGVSLYGIAASLYGARPSRRRWADSGRRAVYALLLCVAVSFGILETAFLTSNFGYEVVATHSSTTTPLFYRATAIWSSQEGSLLLWLLLLSAWSSLVLFFVRNRMREVTPYATAVLLGFGAFFAALLVFLESPFGAPATAVAEGSGLNPLLRHPSMMIHPPMLYSGYTLFAIPFAFAVAALVTRRLNADWIRTTRPFTLGAWFCLGVGIILGARWSYSELGWGGYWAWDPVENASLMPWLIGTAFLHSVMIQEKRGMLKVWNVGLVLATGILAILGTFLVRSGILESIHAFGASTLGIPFLILIVGMIAGSVALVVSRLDDLRSEHKLDSLLSREAVFLGNNLVLVALCLWIFWGTFFPLISEALTGTKASVGPPWFDRYIVPLTLMLVLLSAIGPAIAWRRATAANLRRNLQGPVLFAAAVGIASAVLAGAASKPLALTMFVFGALVLGVSAQELYRGTLARRAMSRENYPRAVLSLVARNRRRYGGYLVHVGVSVLFIGVAASSAFQHERDARMGKGDTVNVGGYAITYEETTAKLVAAPNGRLERIDFGAILRVERGGRFVQELPTRKSFFPSSDTSLGPVSRFFEGEATSEVGLRAGAFRDVWTAIAPDIGGLRAIIEEGDEVFRTAGEALPPAQRDALLGETLRRLVLRYSNDPPKATVRLIVSPLVTWIWIGALLVFAGALIALWPAPRSQPRPVAAAYKARVARELGQA
jgi:cytochrome c-type biogenesis protein CcmF